MAIIYDGIQFNKNGKYYWTGKSPYIALHRYIWEKHNRKIPNGFVIHHIDGNPENNDLSNLQIMSKEEHGRIHGEVRIFTPDHKARISAAKTININSEMSRDVRNGMPLIEFTNKHGYGRAIWEKIKRDNNLMKSSNFKEVTEEMRQDVINGIAVREFATKYNSSSTLFYRIKKEEGLHVGKPIITDEMINDVINNNLPRTKFQEKYSASQTLWVKIRKDHV